LRTKKRPDRERGILAITKNEGRGRKVPGKKKGKSVLSKMQGLANKKVGLRNPSSGGQRREPVNSE